MNTLSHESIVRAALGEGWMSAEALKWIVSANLASDLSPLVPEKHFDNAADRQMLAKRWQKGLHTYLNQACAAITQGKINRRRSLQAFGKASHALADFYAHTDWVELHAALGQPDLLAPLLQNTFPIDLFPVGLSSGFFSLRYGLNGCPVCQGVFKAPPPYHYCHAQIAKDYPDKEHGAERAPDGRTYFEIAFNSAKNATQELWHTYQEHIMGRCGPEVFQKLVWGK
jgi:hypothetical protein